MTSGRALPLVLAFVALSFASAYAQFGGMGMGVPGSPGMGGMQSAPMRRSARSRNSRRAACQNLMALRDETQKAGKALKTASEKKAPPEEACKLFKVFVAAESKMIKGLEENSQVCGVPPDAIKQVKAQHVSVSKMAKQVCDAAAQVRVRPARASAKCSVRRRRFRTATPSAATAPSTRCRVANCCDDRRGSRRRFDR